MKKHFIAAILFILLLLCGCVSEAESPAKTPQMTETPETTPVLVETSKPKSTPKPEPTPEAVDDSFQIEVSDYLLRCADIVDVLPEDTAREQWQMPTPAWHYQGFWLEYQDDPDRGRIFSMQNEEANDVTMYGNRIGETYNEFETDLFAAGWKLVGPLENMREYGIKIQDTCILLALTIDDDGVVHSWYMHNWPQDGWFDEFFSQFDT